MFFPVLRRGALLALLAMAWAGVLGAPLARAEEAAAPAQAAVVRAPGLWIDVRTPEEFSQGHLQGALNLPVSEIAHTIARVAPNKDTPLHLYCRSGRRVRYAEEILRAMGYTRIINHGGYGDLLAQGLR